MARTKINDEDLTFIKDAKIHTVTAEDVKDISTILAKFHHQLEVLGEPVHLRLPPDCQLSAVKMEDLKDKVIDEPYNQYITKVKTSMFSFRRGNPPPKMKNKSSSIVTVGDLMKVGKRPKR